MKKRKKYNEESFSFMPPSAAKISEKSVEEWVEKVRTQLIDNEEPFFFTGSGRVAVLGFTSGKKKEREYRIIVVRDGYEEITITPKP